MVNAIQKHARHDLGVTLSLPCSCCRLLPLMAQDLVCLDVNHSEAHLEQIYEEMGSLKICENATDQFNPR
jgi:hypothetical protein